VIEAIDVLWLTIKYWFQGQPWGDAKIVAENIVRGWDKREQDGVK